jgi:hypothetical protein
MKLIKIFKEVLLESEKESRSSVKFIDLLLEDFISDQKAKYVDDNITSVDKNRKKIPLSIWDEINSYKLKTRDKMWLVSKVVEGIINSDDIGNYIEYLDIFYKYNLGSNIDKVVTAEDLVDFQNKVFAKQAEIRGDASKEKGVNKLDKYKKYQNGKFYLGTVEGFDVFKIPKGGVTEDEKGNEIDLNPMSCELGSGTDWCTTKKDRSSFDQYIEHGPLFFFVKKGGGEAYHFSYEGKDGKSPEFMDQNNRPI